MEKAGLNKTIKQILESRYIVPLYQRNFAWTTDEIAQLLQDVYESFIIDNHSNYFIGSLVVLPRKSGELEVVDGQQRLTVISLIARILGAEFLSEPNLSYDSRPEVESFFSKFYSTGNTNGVSFGSKVAHLVHAVDAVRETVINPNEKNSKTLFDLENLEHFKNYFFNNVIIVRVEIPTDTDVAAYFEIMNNRGEQLQKHEILKASMMNSIRTNGEYDVSKQKLFSVVWDACSQMNIPIQKLFDTKYRVLLFGENFNQFTVDFNTHNSSLEAEETIYVDGKTIDEILETEKQVNNGNNQISDVEDEGDDNSIIDFPNFLMHILRLLYNKIYYDLMLEKYGKGEEIPLNEKDLLIVYNVIAEKVDPLFFLENLLYYRTVFDRYVVKASNDEDAEDNYKWSLEQPYKYYYERKGTAILRYKPTFENQEDLIKALSLLQVTFRNKKYKNWLQDILYWFSDRKNFETQKTPYLNFIHDWLLRYYENNMPSIDLKSPYNEGTRTPHFLFNFIDYLYWHKSKSDSNYPKFDFDYKYRNSVEHHLPQSFSSEKNKDWIDNLGNLCLVSKSSNSKMNNESPIGKASKDGKYYKTTLSPKQKMMYDLTNEKKAWEIDEIYHHYIEVVHLLADKNIILFLH